MPIVIVVVDGRESDANVTSVTYSKQTHHACIMGVDWMRVTKC